MSDEAVENERKEGMPSISSKMLRIPHMNDNVEKMVLRGSSEVPYFIHEKRDRNLVELLASIRDADSGRERSVLIKELAHELAKNIIMTAILTILILIAIFEIFVGTMNVDNCPVKKMIPIWLIVSGSTSCLRYIVEIAISVKDNKIGRFSKFRATWEAIFSMFWLIWFVFGTYWTYSIYNIVVFEQSSANYCDKLTYVFTFVLITACYVMMALWICGCCIVCCCACCLACCSKPK